MINRIIGFDLARAYAIFGMFIVNFNMVFGSHSQQTSLDRFLMLFNGNSSTMFVILAGMGVSLMANSANDNLIQQNQIKKIILKRSLFLFVFGLLFYSWWPADILHFYGGYLHLAALILFVPKQYFLFGAGLCVLIFHGLLMWIPFDTGWNFNNFTYADFWTWNGFLRNTFYNGWNAIFPWFAYFLVGLYLGRLPWKNSHIPNRMFLFGLVLYVIMFFTQTYLPLWIQNPDIVSYLTADYLPPYVPFMLSTTAFSLMLISIFIKLGNYVEGKTLANLLAHTGQMTLTHYVLHLTIGLIGLSIIAQKPLTYDILQLPPTDAFVILSYSICYFVISCLITFAWRKRFKQGPLEMIMRKFSD